MPNLDQELVSKKSSIAERLALLKDNGENNWKKRVKNKDVLDDVTIKTSVSSSTHSILEKLNELEILNSRQSITTKFEEKVNTRVKSQLDDVKAFEFGNLSERVEQIKHNSEKWKSRVGERH
jgi:hypothetical protein